MSYVSTTEFFENIRDLQTPNPLDAVAQQAIDSAEAHVEHFIGQPLDELQDSNGLPAPITSAILILARIEFDNNAPAVEHTLRGRAEALLRPYRIDTGISGGLAA